MIICDKCSKKIGPDLRLKLFLVGENQEGAPVPVGSRDLCKQHKDELEHDLKALLAKYSQSSLEIAAGKGNLLDDVLENTSKEK